MGEWFARLLGSERRLDRYLRMVSDLERKLTALEQQLAQVPGERLMEMDSRGPDETRLLGVERGLEGLDGRLRNLRRRAIAVSQGTWAAWSEVAGITGGPATTPTFISGAPVSGCSGALSGLSVVVTDHMSGLPLGSSMTDGSGNFSLTIGLTSATNIDITVSGTGWVTQTINTTITAGGSFSTGAITLSPAAGYFTSDFASICACLPWTLTLADSVYGNVTLTYDAVNQWWRGCTTWAYPGTVNCPAGNIAVQYTLPGSNLALNWNLTVAWEAHAVGVHACPLPGVTCATSTFATTRVVSVTFPGVSCSSTSTWVFGASANSPWPGAGGATCTVIF